MKTLNLRGVLYAIGISIITESIFLIICSAMSIFLDDGIWLSFIKSAAIGLITGSIMIACPGKKKSAINIKDSFATVSLSWVLLSVLGSLPYILSGAIPEFSNAFFETVSGLTTTGSSILNDIEALPKSILFWRALTHWIGGMGIIVLVLAVIPSFKAGGNHLMMAEGGILGPDKIKPRIIDIAKRLWIIYLSLTCTETILFILAGMDWFDAICHSFATIATGGFANKNTSLIGYSPTIQYIAAIFMLLSGINFSLHFMIIQRKFDRVWKNEELRVYLGIIIITTILITLNLYFKNHMNLEPSFRHAFFQVTSILTATGFASADYELWPHFSMAILFLIMFIGACVGSTGGGIKVIRYVIMVKSIRSIFLKLLSPNSIQVTRYNGKVIDTKVVNGIFSFAIIYFLTFITGSLILIATGLDPHTAFSGIITTLGGIGPGFGTIGPTENFAALPEFAKFYLDFNMILGRLEIISMLVIFSPSFYKI